MLALIQSCAVVLSSSLAPTNYPDVFVEHVDAFFDIPQSLVPENARNGDAYCAPAAVASALCFQAVNGYENLVDGDPRDESIQLKLARTLAAPEYLNTAPEAGTSKEALISGVHNYVRDRGYRVRTSEYRGLEIYFDSAKPSRSTVPELEWLKSRLAAGASCWLQIGWYRRNSEDYKKIGGHWVTLTGYGEDAAGTPDPLTLIIRDPSSRTGPGPSSQYLRYSALQQGRIHGWGLPQPAAGFFDVTEGIVLHEEADRAVLEGAVVITLGQP